MSTIKRHWNRPGIPHKGWRCVDAIDLERATPDAVCQMCGRERLRFVHTMRHPDYPDHLQVGCVCAAKMESDPSAAANRERRLLNLAARRRTWLSRGWRTSRKGNEYRKVQGHVVTVFPERFDLDCWRFSIARGNEKPQFSDSRSATIHEAKLAAFDALADRLGWG